ncbi:HD domain-containing phosphohydrolase [Salinarimonas chemoclinalis]|uniref:HD domain-containing phosphohydrolase n=1 Tax=Salinarimonas chemoclinalis TaxID=3241599 RepID=UPI0035586CCC
MMDFLVDDTHAAAARSARDAAEGAREGSWHVLIVDDEPGVHDVTRLALADLALAGRGVVFHSAFSAREARALMPTLPPLAVILLDVVMETDRAGLDLVRWIRRERGDHAVRIILRTGEPGQAPERSVILDYDINDYKEKAELTAQKLFSAVVSAIRGHRDILALERNRQGLRTVIEASARLYEARYLEQFARGALEQLTSLLYLEPDAALVSARSVAAAVESGPPHVLAAIGALEREPRVVLEEIVPADLLERWISGALDGRVLVADDHIAVCTRRSVESRTLLYLANPARRPICDEELVRLFARNITIAFENLSLRGELEATQAEITAILGGAVETRSQETAHHVTRVSAMAEELGRLAGLETADLETLRLASALHDVGKVGVPDAVLNKPGKLDPDEWEVMKRHTLVGEALLAESSRPVIRAGAIVAGQHHERFDGRGYPRGLSGEAIHLYGRITAIVDVFDALGAKRCYKEPWPLDRIVAHFESEAGAQFDPDLTRLFLDNLERFLEIARRHPDAAAGPAARTSAAA